MKGGRSLTKLVEMATVENSEFKQAIEEMVEQKTEELTEESIAPTR